MLTTLHRPGARRLFEDRHTTNDFSLPIRNSSTGTREWALKPFLPPLTYCRQPGQGGSADAEVRDLRAELLAAEAAHRAKLQGGEPSDLTDAPGSTVGAPKHALEMGSQADSEEDPEAKRRRILEESRDIDADDSEEDDDGDSSDDSDDDDDETAELQRELEKIKRERAEKREREVSDACAPPKQVAKIE